MNLSYIKSINNSIPQKNLSVDNLKFWYFNDIELDTIPGISLNRAYDSLLKKNTGNEIIVAIIDMPIDINHEDLKQNLWINKQEIPNNNKDDDANGYVDDVYGWNFLGGKNGSTTKFVNYEYTRILKKYKSDFENNLISDSLLYNTYIKAKKKHEKRLEYAIEDTSYINIQKRAKTLARKTLSKFFKNETYSIEDLDSLKNAHPNDSIIKLHTRWMKALIKYEFTDEFIDSYKLKADERINKLLNTNYNDRIIIGDNSDRLDDKDYGNSDINTLNGFFDHGTLIAGLIAARRDNNIGIKGISDNIRIMPIAISAFGDEHDKDIALAIRYAVDNGASVINMSFGKEFSLYKKFVFDAIKYAEENDVLIIKSAGNNGENLEDFEVYPNDNNYQSTKEVADNFLMVGATNYNVNKKMVPSFSNYGYSSVDVFAPGVDIYSTSVIKEKYELIEGGTSLSCAITSGVAALLRSHYPNLTASKVKHILMDSGIEYKFNVKIKDSLLPFNRLSKSGKVINVYNALIMADSISRNK